MSARICQLADNRLLETIPEAERVRFLRAGFVTSLPGGPGVTSSGRSLRNCYAPPALRPARKVPCLSADDGAGNARVLHFA
jgi:hypothetical protein